MTFTWIGSLPFKKLRRGMRVVSGHTYVCGTIDYLDWDLGRSDRFGEVQIAWDHGSRSIFWFVDDYDVPMIFVMSPVDIESG